MPPKVTAAAQPTRNIFDAWNSSSSGHQRAENRLSSSTAWRDSRTNKLQTQYAAGAASGGGKRQYDTVGAGSRDFGRDGRTETGWGDSVEGWRGRDKVKATADLVDWLQPMASTNKKSTTDLKPAPSPDLWGKEEAICRTVRSTVDESESQPSRLSQVIDTPGIITPGTDAMSSHGPSRPRPIFAHLTVLISGSTAPLVSDHKLKHLLAAHGARVAIALGRRTVTHVVVGKPIGAARGSGAGGGLAASKIEKEIRTGSRGGGVALRFVAVEWVLESIKAGKRLPESAFPGVNTAPAGVASVRDLCLKKSTLPER